MNEITGASSTSWYAPLTTNPIVADHLAAKPRLLRRAGITVSASALLTLIPALLGWVMDWRLVSTAALVLSALAWAILLIALPITSAARVTRSLFEIAEGEAILPPLPGEVIARGFIWRTILQSPLLVALALGCLPALLVSLFRVDLTHFATWQSAALTLGSAADPASTALLLPGAGIPTFRLILRTLSLGTLLPLLAYLGAAMGVLSACFRPEPGRAMLIALTASLLIAFSLIAAWQSFSLLPSFAGWAEGLRLLLFVFFYACLMVLIAGIRRVIARQLGG